MTRRGGRWGERGQATLEVVILVPMMLLMISLVLYAGWWSYAKLAAQNAAYSYGIFVPRVELSEDGSGRVGNFAARDADLLEPIGMKRLWAENISNGSPHRTLLATRIGGQAIVIAISPRGLSWGEWGSVFESLGGGSGGGRLPSGGSFFFYAPLMSAR